ncbi:MAG: SH3 domain-containing protein [Beijerinckiaceae bacterium]
MFPVSRIFAVTVLLASLPALTFAESEHRTQRIEFKDGRAAMRGHIKGYHKGYHYVDYVFSAGAGESLSVTLKTNKDINYFNLLAPGETEAAFFIGSTSGNHYKGAIPASGDYTARVYLMRSAARRGEAAKYMLTIALGQKRATNEKGPDYADGLTGGPDYWEVTDIGAGDALSLRKEPSPRAELAVQFANGTVLRNLGCKNTRGQRWCRVERPNDTSVHGWVNGHFLRESGGQR